MIVKTWLPGIAVAALSFTVWCLPLPSHAESNGKRVHLHGTLIDVTCWNDRAGNASTLLREHTKRCLEMPECIRSGYLIVTLDGHVYKMDAVSNQSMTRWIAGTPHDANWRVDVKGRMRDGVLDVSRIRLEK